MAETIPDPGPGGEYADLIVMFRWNYDRRDDGVYACLGEHHRSYDCDWFKLTESQQRWYESFIEKGARA